MMEHNRRYHNQSRHDSGHSSTSDFFTQSKNRKPVRKLVTPNSSLEIVDGNQFEGASGFGDDRATTDGSCKSWSRSSFGSVPPRSDSSMSRRTMTPTKQVSLQAVRRREESSESFVDHVDVESAHLNGGGVRRAWDMNDDDVDFSKLSVGDHRKNGHLSFGSPHQVNGESNGDVSHKQSANKNGGNNKLASQKQDSNKGGGNSDDDSDDDEADEDKDENEKLKAPTELLMEFIDCLMKKDYPNASKLCKMILLYEPENEEALKFQPLIEEKMALDEAAAEEGSSDDEDDDDDDDDDDSDDDSSSDDSSEESDDDDVDESSSKEPQPSSGKPSQDHRISGANTTRVWKPAS